jgi:hypothetical protein
MARCPLDDYQVLFAPTISSLPFGIIPFQCWGQAKILIFRIEQKIMLFLERVGKNLNN